MIESCAYGMSLDQLGLNHQNINESLRDTPHGGVTGKIIFADSPYYGPIAIKHFYAPRRACREFAALRIASKTDGKTNVPQAYYCNPNLGLLIEQRVDGSAVQMPSPDIINQVLEIISRIHQHKFSSAGHPDNYNTSTTTLADRVTLQARFIRDWSDEVLRLITNNKLAYSLKVGIRAICNLTDNELRPFSLQSNKPFSLVHYDLNKNHILINDHGQVFLIDWGQSFIADTAMELAKLYYKNSLTADQQVQGAEAYQRFCPTPDHTLVDRIQVYLPLTIAASFCWRIRFLYQDVIDNPQLAQYTDPKVVDSRLQGDINYIISFKGHQK